MSTFHTPHARCGLNCVLLGLYLLGAISVHAESVHGPAGGQASGPTESAAEGRERTTIEWVAKLNAPTRRERALAEQMLIEGGRDVLTELPAPQDLNDVAVRDAVVRIRAKIQSRLAAQMLEGERLTLEREAPATAILRDIGELTGNRLELDARNHDEPVHFDCRDELFWQCLDRLVQRADLDWSLTRDGRCVTVGESRRRGVSDENGSRVAYSGPFRVEIRELKTRPNLVDPQGAPLLRAAFHLVAEPRLRPLYVTIAEEKFAGRRGTLEVIPWNRTAVREIPFVAGEVTVPVDLQVPGEAGSPESDEGTPLELHGRFRVRVIADVVPLRFTLESGSRAVRRRAGPTTVTLEEWIAPRGGSTDGLRVRVGIDFGVAGPELESHRIGGLHQDVFLVTTNGERIFPTRQDLLRAVGTRHEVEFAFPVEVLEDGTQFVYEAPLLVSDVDVPCQWESLRLDAVSKATVR